MNNNAFYEGMLSELTKTAYVLAPRPAPKKKDNSWLKDGLMLGGGLGAMGTAYYLATKQHKPIGAPSVAPAPQPKSAPAGTPTQPSDAAMWWNYAKNNPKDVLQDFSASTGDVAKGTGKFIKDWHTNAYSHAASDPSTAAITAGMDAKLLNKAVSSNVGSKLPMSAAASQGLKVMGRTLPMFGGVTDLMDAAINPNQMNTTDRLGAAGTGAGWTAGGLADSGLFASKTVTPLTRAGGWAPLAAYLAGSAGAAGIEAGSARAYGQADQNGNILEGLGNLQKQLGSRDLHQAFAAQDVTRELFRDPAKIKALTDSLQPSLTTRAVPWLTGVADTDPELNQNIMKRLAQLRQQVDNR